MIKGLDALNALIKEGSMLVTKDIILFYDKTKNRIVNKNVSYPNVDVGINEFLNREFDIYDDNDELPIIPVHDTEDLA